MSCVVEPICDDGVLELDGREVLRREHLATREIACERVDVVVFGCYFFAVSESAPSETAREVAEARDICRLDLERLDAEVVLAGVGNGSVGTWHRPFDSVW